ncbi:MAG: oligoribonuclease [Woeseia sp.]|nr:oligoribonuclease [Woeseia sp.]|tara:strand:- start:966 stop:1523 length:558 start_codon:yes stop_codon:yes gene_type:complete
MIENESVQNTNLIWIDLEMTGLSTQSDTIIEIATVITDKNLNELAVGPVIAIKQSKKIMDKMDNWNKKHHSVSGLTERVLNSNICAKEAEELTLNFLKEWVSKGISPMCGNSICQDRRFLAREMPKLESFFHYRNLDVSTLKIIANMWAPDLKKDLKKKSAHLALSDIRDSIDELKYYRKYLLNN